MEEPQPAISEAVPPAPAPAASQQSSAEEPGRFTRKERWDLRLGIAGCLLNAVIAACTVGGFLVLLDQVRDARRGAEQSSRDAREAQAKTQAAVEAAQRSATTAENALRADQRAWVGLTAVPVITMTADTPTTIELEMRNSGRSPALHLVTNANHRILPAGKALVPSLGRRGPSKITLQPSTAAGIRVDVEALNQGQLDALRYEMKRLYVYGRIDYDDIFGVAHYSTFCFFLLKDLRSNNACGNYAEAN